MVRTFSLIDYGVVEIVKYRKYIELDIFCMYNTRQKLGREKTRNGKEFTYGNVEPMERLPQTQ
jgi:hypothetical protein